MDVPIAALPACINAVLIQLLDAVPPPAQAPLLEGHTAAQVLRGLRVPLPYSVAEAERILATLLPQFDRAGLPWEPLAWLLTSFARGRDQDVAWVLLDRVDAQVGASLRAALAADRGRRVPD
ncbi:MAG TPA: hypothetical protein VHB98_24015 [Chloroflexota bacterium]|jgi:hypothetical protein|nr:hypothetical protein [Chloroflexota bacterium]